MNIHQETDKPLGLISILALILIGHALGWGDPTASTGRPEPAERVKQEDLTRKESTGVPPRMFYRDRPYSGVAEAAFGKDRLERTYVDGSEIRLRRFNPEGRLWAEHFFEVATTTRVAIKYHDNGLIATHEVFGPQGSVKRSTWDETGCLTSETGPTAADPKSGFFALLPLGFRWKNGGGGLTVAAVTPSSPAAQGRFQQDDALLTVEGTTIQSPQQFLARVDLYASGTKLKIGAKRNGRPETLWLVVPDRAFKP